MGSILNVALAVVLVFLTAFSKSKLTETVKAAQATFPQKSEVLYLPSGKGLEVISLGYRNLLGDLLWFNTVNYFGKHFGGDRNYHWLAHMCRLVTTLDPRAKHVYKFCSTMLTWEANQPAESVKMLSSAIKQFPDDWTFYSLRAFTYMLFLDDEEKAGDDLKTAAALPDAPALIQRLAAKKMALSSPETAITFLQDMVKKAKNDSERQALQERLREAVYERDAQTLEKAIGVYEVQKGQRPATLQSLVTEGIVSKIDDPFGGIYKIDEATGKVVSSTGRKRLKMYRSASRDALQEKWER